jgi:Flp pilus assembly protein TadD
MNSSNTLITVCDHSYFTSAKTLIASVHRLNFDVIDKIIVYNLGLNKDEIDDFNKMEKTIVLDFYLENDQYFLEYMNPKQHGYKLLMKKEAYRYAKKGDRLLYLDAGIVATKNIGIIFDLIEQDDVFVVIHNFDGVTDYFMNKRWTHEKALSLMNASEKERNMPQVHGGIFGYKLSGKYQHIIDQAFEFSKNPDILLGSHKNHRQDQSILTTLCARYDVPVQDGEVFGEFRGYNYSPKQILYVHRRVFVNFNGIKYKKDSINSQIENIRYLMDSDNFEEACKVIEEAVDKYPNSPQLLNLKGELLWRLGKINEATELFLYIREHWPSHIETLNNIAIILCYEKKWDEAIKLFQKILLLSPSNKEVLENMIFVNNELIVLKAKNLVQEKMFIEAKTLINQVLAINDQHIEALNLSSIIQIKNGNFEKAKEILTLILQIEPTNEEALQNLKCSQQLKPNY